MAKLHVQVCKIDNIEDLDNADRMQMATVKGWQCLIQKNSYNISDLVIFVPIDAVMPYNLIEELKLDYLKGHGRVKTVKLRGYVSQGIVLPIEKLFPTSEGFIKEGTDVAKQLGITKYVITKQINGNMTPKNLGIKIKDILNGMFVRKIKLGRGFVLLYQTIKNHLKGKRKVNVNFDKYTNIDNIKHYSSVFKEGEEVVITSKIHGSNWRGGTLEINKTFLGYIKTLFTGNTYEWVYGSHNIQKTVLSGKGWYGEDVWGQIAEKYNLKEIIPKDYLLYGELYGSKIQELNYGLNNNIDVVFFDVKYKGKYLNWEDFDKFCKERNLPIVPVLYTGKYSKEILEKCTNGKAVLNNANHIREGCVVKPLKEEYSNRCGRKILKSISTDYLLSKKCKDNPKYQH